MINPVCCSESFTEHFEKKNELKYRCHVCKCRTSTFTSFEKNSIHLFACGIFALFFEFNFYKGVFAKHIRMHTMYIILYQEYIYDTTEQPETSRLEVSFLQLQRKCTNIGIETLCKHLLSAID